MTVINTPNRGASPSIAAYAEGYERGFGGCPDQQPPAYAREPWECAFFGVGLSAGIADHILGEPRGASFCPPTDQEVEAERDICTRREARG